MSTIGTSPRRREYSTREMVRALPKDQRAQFLALDPAERQLLMNGSAEEREHYGWLPAEAAKRFARQPEADRRSEAEAALRERRRARAPSAPAVVAAPIAPELNDSSGRVAESVRDIFELGRSGLERARSIAMNWLQAGADEGEALDRVAEVLMDELPLPAAIAPPSRMQLLFAHGNSLRA